MKYWRTRAAPPATAGVEWLVPEEAEYHCWVVGKKLLPLGPPHTPEPSKHERASPLGRAGGSARWPAVWATPPDTCVPGATISGFLRPSAVGPRLEKLMMSLRLSAPVSAMAQLSAPPKAWTFSEAPTVMTFLAVPGLPTEFADGPLLPAAKAMTISWLPTAGTAAVAGCESRTRPSYACAAAVYALLDEPQLLLLMRMPSR